MVTGTQEQLYFEDVVELASHSVAALRDGGDDVDFGGLL